VATPNNLPLLFLLEACWTILVASQGNQRSPSFSSPSGSDAGSSIRRLLARPFTHHAPITATRKTTLQGSMVEIFVPGTSCWRF
jgi:hypothetical protein